MSTTCQNVFERLASDVSVRQDNWCLPTEACKLLHILVKTQRTKMACEVGTSIGYSTLWIASALKETGGKLHTIDAFESRQTQARQNLQDAGLADMAECHLGDAIETLKSFQKKNYRFDFAFIDAAKKQYIDYFYLLDSMLEAGGLFVADNTQSHRDDMSDFIQTILSHPNYECSDINTPTGLIIARKKGN